MGPRLIECNLLDHSVVKRCSEQCSSHALNRTSEPPVPPFFSDMEIREQSGGVKWIAYTVYALLPCSGLFICLQEVIPWDTSLRANRSQG